MNSRAKLLTAVALAILGGAAAWNQLSRTLGPSMIRGDVPRVAMLPPSLEVLTVAKSPLEVDLNKSGVDRSDSFAQFRERTTTIAVKVLKDQADAAALGETFSQSLATSITGSFERREARLKDMGFEAIEQSSSEGAAKWWKQMQEGYRDVRLFSLEGLEVREVAKGRKELIAPAIGDAVRTQGRPPGSNTRLEQLLDKGASVIEVRLPASAPAQGEGGIGWNGRETVMVGYRFVRDEEKRAWIQFCAVLYMPYNNQRVIGLPM